MRLNSIKLAGFKSFVDPTQLVFQSNLTAIVGPNGCGKSNIVDAIYCVLGSTSKNLRAEQMADVIFNGTSSRKPVGQASIELLFDNTDGKLSGEYAKYPEISIRRELTRDGLSNYYLNGTRCRRRDITDLFLGTGLGNNSYAIIEQGMISRLIEAKPEELRAHVEEAAGTSKYKERRRETENRIRHTRENLDRLNDLREEQAKQLNHLQKQANAAEKFKLIKAEQRLLRAELQLILWQTIQEKMSGFEQSILTHENLLEAKIAELRNIDKNLEYNRQARTEHSDILNEIQSHYYSLGADISRIEQNIAHAKERKKQLEADYAQLETAYQELQQQEFEDKQQLQELTDEMTAAETTYLDAKQQVSIFDTELKAAEEKMHYWQDKWDEFQQVSANSSKQVEVAKTQIQHLEQKQVALARQIEKITEENLSQNTTLEAQELVGLNQQQKQCQTKLETLQEQLNSIQEMIQLQRGNYQQAQQDVNKLTKELRDTQAQHASMQAVQQIALGKNKSEIKPWLTEYALDRKQRLAEGIEVTSGWEQAVETVLAEHLDAICIDDYNPLITAIDQLQNAEINFFNINAVTKPTTKSKQLTLLQEKITSNWPVANLLQNIYVTNNLTEALKHLPSLADGESIVTQDGIWLSHHWLRASKSKTQKSGVLQREHDLKELQQTIHNQQSTLADCESLFHETETQLNQLTDEREIVQQQLQSVKAESSDLFAQIKAKDIYLQQITQKQQLLSQELAENEQQLRDTNQLLEEARINLSTFSKHATQEQEQREYLLTEREQHREQLNTARQQTNTCQQKTDQSQIRVESIRNQIHYLNQNLSRLQRQLETVAERQQLLADSLNNDNDPLPELTLELQANLEKRAIVEEQLTKARQTLEAVENTLQDLEKNRQQIEIRCQELRTILEQIRLETHTMKVKLLNHEEQIHATGHTLESLQSNLPEAATAADWEEKLVRQDNRITRLGPINLAAIEEYATLSERKQYLDKQYEDLIEALTTLENAIRKIDKETRIRFKETFTQLNDSFSVYFKQIFGGGNAYLELTSEDLLETGVMVKAQPPGKKNTTIHLLSGGEKALTAIALVFAIFSLNPAPFCVLDEVDAPLDDVNVGRFCNLVRKMAEKIQFVFISHNKITIEMGQQLAGVTMNEPGVSRLVSVDVEQAISMATA